MDNQACIVLRYECILLLATFECQTSMPLVITSHSKTPLDPLKSHRLGRAEPGALIACVEAEAGLVGIQRPGWCIHPTFVYVADKNKDAPWTWKS